MDLNIGVRETDGVGAKVWVVTGGDGGNEVGGPNGRVGQSELVEDARQIGVVAIGGEPVGGGRRGAGDKTLDGGSERVGAGREMTVSKELGGKGGGSAKG